MSDEVMLSGPREDTPAELGLQEIILLGWVPAEVTAELDEYVAGGTARKFVDAAGRTVYQELTVEEQIEATVRALVAAGLAEVVRERPGEKTVYRVTDLAALEELAASGMSVAAWVEQRRQSRPPA